jgi:hypothetical protein
LLPTVHKNVPCCCLQRRSFFRIVGNNAEKCSNFSSCVFFPLIANNADYFSALWTTAQKNYLRCCLQHGKMVRVLGTTQENVRNRISVRIRNHMRIYTRVSTRSLG